MQDQHYSQKEDTVQRRVTTINESFKDYTFATQTRNKIAKRPGDQSSDAKYQQYRKEVAKLDKQTQDNVHIAAAQICPFISEQSANSLLALANEQSLRQNPDLWAHYCRMEALFLRLVVVQYRAMILLKLAASDSQVKISSNIVPSAEKAKRIKKSI